MALEKLTRLAGGMLRYRYALDGNGEVAFDFNTLAEVGEPYQAWFREEIAARGWTVEFGRFLDAPPWVADFVTNAASADPVTINHAIAEVERLRAAGWTKQDFAAALKRELES